MNIVVVIDAWNKWPVEDRQNFPTISKEARAFGSYVNIMLNHIRELDDTQIIHYTWNRSSKFMDEIQRKNDKTVFHIYNIFEPFYDTDVVVNLYACGFHYGICVENFLYHTIYHHQDHIKNIGLIDNLTLRHPKHSYSDIKSKYNHYYYTQAGGFELMDLQSKDTVV